MSGHHSLLSPSSASRWLNCSASLQYQQEEKGNLAADEGTAYHFLAYVCKKRNLPTKLFIGKTYDVNGKSYVFERSMCNAVQRQLNWLEEEHGSNCSINLETQVPVTEEDFGTLDYSAYNKDNNTLWVVDWKFGRVEVDPEENEQLMIYAYGLCDLLKVKPDIINIVICQPRFKSFPSLWQTNYEQVSKIKTKVSRIRNLYDLDILSYNYSVKNCKYCPALKFCPQVKKKVLERLRLVMQDLDNINHEDKVFLVCNFEIIKKLAESFTDDFTSMIKRGDQVEGLKLVKGRKGKSSFSDEDLAAVIVKEKLEQLNIDESEAFNLKLRTPNQILDLLGSDTPEDLLSLITEAEASYKLVPDSHKGEAYRAITSDIFSNL